MIKMRINDKMTMGMLKIIDLAIFGQLISTTGCGPSHTVARGFWQVTYICDDWSPQFVTIHLNCHLNIWQLLKAQWNGFSKHNFCAQPHHFIGFWASHTVVITDFKKKSYTWVDGKVGEAMPDADEGERANDGKGRGARLQLMKVFTFRKTWLDLCFFY